MEMVMVILLTVVFTGITQVNAATNAPAPVTNINTGLSRLTSAVDKRAEAYMLSEATGNVKGELTEFVNNVKTDIERSSEKSGIEFGDVVSALGKVYEKRMTDSSSRIMDCEKSARPTETCYMEMLKFNQNQAVMIALSLAIVDHYLAPALKEFGPDGDDSTRKFIEQELEKKHNPVK